MTIVIDKKNVLEGRSTASEAYQREFDAAYLRSFDKSKCLSRAEVEALLDQQITDFDKRN